MKIDDIPAYMAQVGAAARAASTAMAAASTAAKNAALLALARRLRADAAALVLVVARWGFGLQGLALQVCVMMAALPSGTNALIFAQRYRTLEPEATAVIVMSTGAYLVTASFWLAVLGAIA